MIVASLATAAVLLAACSSATGARHPGPDSRSDVGGRDSAADRVLNVVATTTIVGDVVSRVGGDEISLVVLLPPGADPHGFEPTPRDVAAVADADVVFVNGLGLEEFVEPMLHSAGGVAKVISVSEGIETLTMGDEPGGHDHEGDEPGGHDHQVDPHVWFDPNNVAIWGANVERALTNLDPDRAGSFQSNSADLAAELAELDNWIQAQVDTIPRNRRQLVSNHDTFGYFGHRYGLEQLGTLRGLSTISEPSASDLARLEDTIRAFDVPAIFVGNTVSPDLAKRVAEDTGTQVVTLHTGSLSEPDGPAGTYDSFMRYNVAAIVGALASQSPSAVEP